MGLKILHLTNAYGEKHGGGIHEVVHNLCINQAALGHEPHVWYPAGKKCSKVAEYQIKEIEGLESFKYFRKLILNSDFKNLGFDLIHQHGIWLPTSLINLKLKRLLGIPSIVQPHGLLDPVRMKKSYLKKWVVWFLYEKRNLNSSNLILACSEQEKNTLNNFIKNKIIHVISNGISEEILIHQDTIELMPEKTPKIVLFLSQIIPIKGLERLFDVLTDINSGMLSDWEFHIAGYSEKKYQRKLQMIADKSGLNNIVKFIGPVYGEDKIKTFDTASVFILPSYNENFGIVIAEAMARGIPVITTKGTPWSDVETFNCGFWVDNSFEGIKDGLIKMLNTTKEERSRMGSSGLELIRTKFLWKNAAIKSIELYENILKNKSVILEK